ncbi:MAG TPA: diguanylate cyclase, partial [Acidimicrobiales bacterium]|nr:diguanylate cyclase [Acidimicrobiales bacterium]
MDHDQDSLATGRFHTVANGVGTQQLANSMLGALLAVARRQAGDAGVDRILSRAGEERSASDLQTPGGWSTYEQGLALFAAAADVLDDPDVGRKAGVEVLRQYSGTEVLAILRSIGSPAELLRVYPAISAKQSTITRSEVVEVGDNYGLVAQVTPDHRRDPLFCGYTLGALSQFPVLYGMEQAHVEEIECQTRGDARCLIRVEWDPTSSARADLEHEVGMLRDRILVLTERYESLESVARELASIRDVTSMLETITRQAGVAVRAQRYLLVARLPGDLTPRIHHVGFTDAGEAERAADDVMHSHGVPSDQSRIVVDIESSRRNFGRLAVFYPSGYQFLPQERTLLMAYAGHAAAALDTAAALAESRDRNSSLSALLALAMALAEQSSRSRVAQHLADAVPEIAGYDEAHVLLWEEGDALLSHAASNARIPRGTALPTSTALRVDALADRLLTTPAPAMVTAGSDPVLSPVLSLTGLQAGVVVPISARSTLFGVLVVGSDSGAVEPDEGIRERLSGVGSLAATALDSVALLDEVRHQALHDPLTELANSRLFEQQVSQALSLARRSGGRLAMLFIDLDGFKTVN